jgi:ADP-heptose:LPS heptosyltransferase
MAGKILIIHSGGIGDLLLALPAMRIFRAAFPLSTLELLGRPERLALIAHDLRAESLHSIDQAEMAYFFLEGSPLPPGLSGFFSSFRTALIFGKASGKSLAENLKRLRVRVISIPPFPTEGSGVHASDFLIDLLREAGFTGEKNLSPLRLSETSLSFGIEFRAAVGLKEGQRTLAIHPGSGSPTKNWDPRRFAEVVDWASHRSKILLILGPAEEGAQDVKRLMARAKPSVADQLPLVQLAGVLKTCSVYLGNDSGITHLAAALGVPTVVIFGSTDPAVWGPWAPGAKIISGVDADPTPRSSIHSKSCCAALEEVDARTVIQSLDSLLTSFPPFPG